MAEADRYCVNCAQTVAPQVDQGGSGCLALLAFVAFVSAAGAVGRLWFGERMLGPLHSLPPWPALVASIALTLVFGVLSARAAQQERARATCPICKSRNLTTLEAAAPAGSPTTEPPPAG